MSFKEFLNEEKDIWLALELEDLLELIYTERGQLTQANVDKVKELSKHANRRRSFTIGRQRGTMGWWIDNTIREWEKANGTFKFSEKVKTISAMCNQIEEFTKGEKVWRKSIVFTDMMYNKTKTPSDFIVYESSKDRNEAYEWLKQYGKEVKITEMSGNVESTGLKIGNFIIEKQTSRNGFELSVVTTAFFKSSTKSIK